MLGNENKKNAILFCIVPAYSYLCQQMLRDTINRWQVWLRRIHRSGGFGIQSPKDYAFVRYVVNEHWPYYAYDTFPATDWLTQKLGRLYFRLANWRQPTVMLADRWQDYWQAGCRKTRFSDTIDQVELARIDADDQQGWHRLLPLCNQQSVVVVEDICHHWKQWHALKQDVSVGTTFDLYYCGIIFFDTQRYKHHYIINF